MIDGQPDRIEGYEHFFGFNEAPFSLAPNPRFLFESASHAAALAQVAYALQRREPLVVITGEIGMGKTLLCRTVLQRLERKTFVSVINDPLLERDDLLKQLLEDFGVISKDRSRLAPTSRHDLIAALQDFLASLIPLHAHAVVIIDEAQHLQPGVLEEIRLLSNIDDEQGTMLQIILVGQTDLEPLLSRPELRQLQQRVSRRFRLEPLDVNELAQYIQHRLKVAHGGETHSSVRGAVELERAIAEWHDLGGAPEDRRELERGVSFTPDAIETLSKLSAGVPRVVNILCDRALEAAYSRQTRTIDTAIVNAAAQAVGLPGEAEPAPVVPGMWSAPLSRPLPVEPEARHETDTDTVPLTFGAAAETPAGVNKWLLLGGALVVGFAVIWFGVQALSGPADGNTPAQPQEQPPVTSPAPPPARRQPAPPTGGAAAPPPTANVPPTTPEAVASAPPAAASTASAAGQRYEIVIASFRTESRASTVANQVTALGVPIRRRETDGWQQVLAGPFTSRAEADKAQQQLTNAGFTGTQVVVSAR